MATVCLMRLSTVPGFTRLPKGRFVITVMLPSLLRSTTCQVRVFTVTPPVCLKVV